MLCVALFATLMCADIDSPQLCQLCCIQGGRCRPFVAAGGNPTTLDDGMPCKYGACQAVGTHQQNTH